MKKYIKYIILIITIILLIWVCYALYNKLMISKISKLLLKNDSTNYTLEQTDETTTIIKVNGTAFLAETDYSLVWISEKENKRVVADKNDKIAIITEDPEEKFNVKSLNYTFINEYLENSNLKQKYLGKENECYKVKFTGDGSWKLMILYINSKTGVVEKQEYIFDNDTKNVINFKVTKNNVKLEEVSYPDLTEYDTVNSVNKN